MGRSRFTLAVERFTLCVGERVALVGPSGCGKSTLLDLLALVSQPDRAKAFHFMSRYGAVDVASVWAQKSNWHFADSRRISLGYILQTGGLLPFLTVDENIGLSLSMQGKPTKNAVLELSSRLGIERQLGKKPDQLSVGERQRVAIVRALVHNPEVVLADEPTAALDPIRAAEVMDLFSELVVERGVAVIMATHDREMAIRYGFRLTEFTLSTVDDNSSWVKATVNQGIA